MDKAERARLLRQRFRAIGGQIYVPSAKPRRFRYDIRSTPIVMGWPEAEGNDRRAPGWMKQPDAKLSLAPKPERRRKGASALTRIAERWAAHSWREETKRLDLHKAYR